MNFTFHQLKIFLAVIRHQNITRAAEEMHMTQPALSIQLKNLQKQFDIPLIEKAGRKIRLTDFGKSIAQIAKNILIEAEELKYRTKEYEGLLTGKLKISAASTGKYVIPYYLSEFVHKYPGIDLTLDVSNKATVVKQLQKNEIDFALVSVLPEKLDTDEEILLENKLYLIGNTKKIIESRPLIYREQGSATRNAMSMYFRNSTKRKSIELTSNETVKQAVVAGLGYSIIPLIGMRNELQNEDIYILPSNGLPILTYWRLIWLKNKKLSPVASAYLDFIRKEKEAIIKKHFGWYVNFKK
jgi:DNA-binding transcriptional LysR family regulator